MIEFCLSLAPTNQYYSDICLAFLVIASLIILHEACLMTLHINIAWGLPQQINCYHYLLLCIRCMMWGLPQQITNQYFIDVCLTFSFVASLIILQGACPRTLRIFRYINQTMLLCVRRFCSRSISVASAFIYFVGDFGNGISAGSVCKS